MIFFLHCTWCILQNLCGLAVFAACRKDKRFRFGKAAVVTVWRLPYGLSLGAFIFVPDEKNAPTLNHEYGHTVQSLILGPLYLPIIAIPSARWCILPPFIGFRKRRNISYYAFYTEKWANYCGKRATSGEVPK